MFFMHFTDPFLDSEFYQVSQLNEKKFPILLFLIYPHLIPMRQVSNLWFTCISENRIHFHRDNKLSGSIHHSEDQVGTWVMRNNEISYDKTSCKCIIMFKMLYHLF